MFHRMMNYGELEARPTTVLTIDVIKKILPKFKRHDDLIIVQEQAWTEFKKALPMPVASCENSPFSIDEDELASLVCQAIQKPACRRLAVEKRVKNDGYRRPTVELLLGHNGLVRHRDNHILYQFDVTKCMFSFGNVSEKMRMAALDCSEEVVVDLFAGIGYFTLPLLIHSKAKHLYACEWNPDAIEALRNNLILNKIDPNRCTIIEGDNRSNRPTNVAQRVLLGILPSCRDFMRTALDCVDKRTGAILHCHDLVQTKIEEKNGRLNNEDAVIINPPSQSNLTSSSASITDIKTIDADHHSPLNTYQASSATSSHSTIDKLLVPLDDMRLQSSKSVEEGFLVEQISGSLTKGESNILRRGMQSNTSTSSEHNESEGENRQNHVPLSPTNENEFNPSNHHPTDGNHNVDEKSLSDDALMNAFRVRAQILIESMADDLKKYKLTSKLIKIQPVKSYAPHVNHVVFDIRVEPCDLQGARDTSSIIGSIVSENSTLTREY